MILMGAGLVGLRPHQPGTQSGIASSKVNVVWPQRGLANRLILRLPYSRTLKYIVGCQKEFIRW
jgi:hypothetical protein